MKKTASLLLALVLCLQMCACGSDIETLTETISKPITETTDPEDTSEFDALIKEIGDLVDQFRIREAVELCNTSLEKDIKEEQKREIKNLRKSIYSLTFPGTYVVRPDVVCTVATTAYDNDGRFTLGKLKEEMDSSVLHAVLCKFKFEKWSEKVLAAKQYQDYLNSVFICHDIEEYDDSTTYMYVDEYGNAIQLNVEEGNTVSFTVAIDIDMYDTTLIDMSRGDNTSLMDDSLWLFGD